MENSVLWTRRDTAFRPLALGLLLAASACGDGQVAPTETATLPADSPTAPAAPGDTGAPAPADSAPPTPGDSAPPADSTLPLPADTGYSGAGAAVLDTRSRIPGIVFGTSAMDGKYLNTVHTGWHQGGPLGPSNIISKLTEARAKGGRVVLKLVKGHDRYVQNGDRTFSLTKWKALVDQYKAVNLRPFIDDGTIIGHYLIDEPHRTARWGGKIISQGTLEEMARHSKRIWPGLTTMVRVVPSWLASSPMSYVHLDAGWTQYTAGKGDATKWVTAEAAAAKRKGLGLVVGLNVLGGGPSGRPMTATELKTFGTAMLKEPHACAFFMWMHDLSYYGRSDIHRAMAALSAQAKVHVKTSCRQ